ncbi:hypothetical protein RRG08_059375 [Elysia crispata]|uniref:Uncharacterized protein n=1 Tax=Elysia crispata TaxID=231223 RepID=A0AAE1EF65_9GAST|nr:hypothetical protein RRG08_059375 [Elysia crispata]
MLFIRYSQLVNLPRSKPSQCFNHRHLLITIHPTAMTSIAQNQHNNMAEVPLLRALKSQVSVKGLAYMYRHQTLALMTAHRDQINRYCARFHPAMASSKSKRRLGRASLSQPRTLSPE